jgi:hypothetical protein
VKILSLIATGRNPVFEYVDQILLESFEPCH